MMCHSSTSTEAALQQPEHPVTTAALRRLMQFYPPHGTW